jgi:hypothetical protein
MTQFVQLSQDAAGDSHLLYYFLKHLLNALLGFGTALNKYHPL